MRLLPLSYEDIDLFRNCAMDFIGGSDDPEIQMFARGALEISIRYERALAKIRELEQMDLGLLDELAAASKEEA